MSDWETDGEEDQPRASRAELPPTEWYSWKTAGSSQASGSRPVGEEKEERRGGNRWGSRPASARQSGTLEYRARGRGGGGGGGGNNKQRLGSLPLCFPLDNALVGTLIGKRRLLLLFAAFVVNN